MKILSAAKINLFLEVKGRRPDGYHEIETVLQPVSLYDEIELERAPAGIDVAGDDPSIPWNEDNLCHRAARLLFERTGYEGGLRIRVRKGIPSGAGLGGGSSDAAATLVGANLLLGLGLEQGALLGLGSALGSDVPFFIFGRPAIGRGRGEFLEGVEGLPAGWILIVKPDVTISTKWAYENLNLMLTRPCDGNRLRVLVEDMAGFPSAPLHVSNSFEMDAARRFPAVADVLGRLREAKPHGSGLSGSGSACFAVFSDEAAAREVGEHFESEGLFSRVVRPVNRVMQFG